MRYLNMPKDQSKVSPIAIRRFLAQGDVTSIHGILGHPYKNKGTIIRGKQRGRKLGFPTINVQVLAGEELLAEGVYAVKVEILGKVVLGMASIGRNETFGEKQALTLEVNLLDFSKMVYSEHVVIHWYQRLRGQVKYERVTALIGQLKHDEVSTRSYFKRIESNLATEN